MELLDRIDSTSAIPKYLQVVNAVIQDIEAGVLKRGERVPSINETSEMYYLSRDTIEKAYRILRKKGVISSVKGKGCYISNSFAASKIRVLLLFNKLSAYKKAIYYSMLKVLGEDAVVDLHIHHYDGKICGNLIQENIGKYDYYVVMPHISSGLEEFTQALNKIPEDKLILLDKNVETFHGNCGAVFQDFERDIRRALHSGEDLLSKYNKFVLVYPREISYPIEIVKGFRQFCREMSMEHAVIGCVLQEPLVPGTAFLVLEESDLANLITQTRANHLQLGKDIGLISYNDTPLKKILDAGITVVSTDHELMGETAGFMIKQKLREKIHNPFMLVRRNSL
ncbi:GntR family transcriptional regulator [Rufibacter glacialis]|uniref:GntR family transcriptional regulator n=1 Tax=Rufibacter glacialis TaxID=1259555 RepID=A0A5M8Q8M2_9BACT|nr:GntR family transcriptional regulator [Rufibacter glacialis]KAA6432305.1 GntR family transcriptional regulator [Rufibacter glacialis]GGK77590.1 transcriptional regulator [Rufibacter glacialis]